MPKRTAQTGVGSGLPGGPCKLLGSPLQLLLRRLQLLLKRLQLLLRRLQLLLKRLQLLLRRLQLLVTRLQSPLNPPQSTGTGLQRALKRARSIVRGPTTQRIPASAPRPSRHRTADADTRRGRGSQRQRL